MAELRDLAPDMSAGQLTDLYRYQTMTQWIEALQSCPRETRLTLDTGRSLVALLGHSEASRMVRHVDNFPSCLPTHAVGPD